MEANVTFWANIASIVSCLLTIFAVTQIYQIKNTILKNDSTNNNKQNIKGTNNTQAGRDINGK